MQNSDDNPQDIIALTYEFFETELATFIQEYYRPINELMEAASYSLGGQGKRVRPMLTLLATQAFGGEKSAAIPAAIAVEMIHAYSLIHDDLPCMDDDRLRRGKATTHVKFGEATALLAGDALLSDSFEVLATWQNAPISDHLRTVQIKEIAHAAGSRGMVLGQSMDLYWTNRDGASEEDIDDIHLTKTGSLMGAACAMGAISANASNREIATFRQFGRTIGLAFQIQDDLLDDSLGTGKSSGKDREANKLTYLRFMTRQEAKLNSQKLIEAAAISVKNLPCDSDAIIDFALGLVSRTT